MSHVFSVPLRVRGYECSVERTVSLPQVLSYMEHARWAWIMTPGLGLVDGLHSGHFFVVHRQIVSLARGFGIDTALTVRAALRQVGRVSCEVDQDLVRDDGALLARARITAVWLGPGGHMARIPDRTREAVTDEALPSIEAPPSAGRASSFLSPAEPVYPVRLDALVTRAVPDDAAAREVEVARSQCDMFGHVNGSNYLRIFEDTLGRHAVTADVEYRGQAQPGDRLVVRAWGGAAGSCFALSRGADVLCRAVLR
jgi:acyl-CoA thioesterase FadM